LHLWQVGPGHLAVVASIVTHHPRLPSAYKAKLKGIANLGHISIEIDPDTNA
jgi:Co/Zn/Cd efflux system component